MPAMKRNVTIRLPDRIPTNAEKVADEALRVASELITLARDVHAVGDDADNMERLELMVAAWEHRSEKGLEARRICIMQKLDAFVAIPTPDHWPEYEGDPAINLGLSANPDALAFNPLIYLKPDGLFDTWEKEEIQRWQNLMVDLVRAWKNDKPGARPTDDAPSKYVLLSRALKLLGDDVTPDRLTKLRREYRAESESGDESDKPSSN